MNVTVTDESAAARELMEVVLREGRPLASEYPLVFEHGFTGRVITIQDDTESTSGATPPVVSTCAILPRELVTPEASFLVGLVGSVATDPDHRGKGHGAEVLERAEAELAADGCMMNLLWADDADWYQQRGWIPVGTEIVYVVDRGQALLLPDPIGVRPATSEDHQRIHELYEENTHRVRRTPAETAALLEGPGIEVLVCELEGNVVAYSCLGRGEDLQNVVHEWSGSVEYVLALFRGHMDRHYEECEQLYMMVPPSAAEFIAFFEFTRTPGARGVVGMAKLASLEAAVSLFTELVPSEVQVDVDATQPNAIRVVGPKGEVTLVGHEILLTLVPPRGDRMVIDVVEDEIGCSLPSLPLQPFLWGLDSI